MGRDSSSDTSIISTITNKGNNGEVLGMTKEQNNDTKSGSRWHEEVTKAIASLQYIRSTVDRCLFYKTKGRTAGFLVSSLATVAIQHHRCSRWGECRCILTGSRRYSLAESELSFCAYELYLLGS